MSANHGGSLAAVVGVTLRACVVEKHVKLEGVESADSKFSMTTDEFKEMVSDIRNAKRIARGPHYELTGGEKASTAFRRSLFAVKDMTNRLIRKKTVSECRSRNSHAPGS